MATIKQVAKRAGVSTATVSRVLNGNYTVREKTAVKVREALKELNYQMNGVAKSLKLQKSFTIALVIPFINSDYLMEIMNGIESIIHETNYTLSIYVTDNLIDREMAILKELYEKRIDGVILYSVQNRGEELQELIDQGLKIVFLDNRIKGVTSTFLIEDNEKMTCQLVDYALNQGHKKVGVVVGTNCDTGESRYKGFIQALDKHNLILEEKYRVEGNFIKDIAKDNTKRMLHLNSGDLPTLIFAENHHMTEGVLIAIKDMGLKVPDDISVISYGQIALHQLYEPKLTIVEQNPFDMGKQAAGILLNSIETQIPLREEVVTIDSKVILGNSIKRV